MEKEPLKYQRLREEMVRQQIEARGVADPAVLAALRRVPRHIFVSEALRDQAYGDFPLPIGEQQTISQPYIVAEMSQALQLSREDRVLEIGTGSGYQAAILAQIAYKVYTIERIRPPPNGQSLHLDLLPLTARLHEYVPDIQALHVEVLGRHHGVGFRPAERAADRGIGRDAAGG